MAHRHSRSFFFCQSLPFVKFRAALDTLSFEEVGPNEIFGSHDPSQANDLHGPRRDEITLRRSAHTRRTLRSRWARMAAFELSIVAQLLLQVSGRAVEVGTMNQSTEAFLLA